VFQHTVQPLLESFVQGFNATVFAYGQTVCLWMEWSIWRICVGGNMLTTTSLNAFVFVVVLAGIRKDVYDGNGPC
jgi:hypothetical protein